jgi:hydrogenase maturation protease
VTLVVGIGNPDRGDDGVGPAVAAALAALHLPEVEVVVRAEPLALLDLLERDEVVVVVDASAPGTTPGRVRVWSPGQRPPAGVRSAGTSSHGLGVADVVALATVLGRLRARVTVVGVEAASCTVGAPLSDRLRAGVEAGVRAVRAALAQDAPHPS